MGREASPSATEVYLILRAGRFWGCYATQREQAPSPQGRVD